MMAPAEPESRTLHTVRRLLLLVLSIGLLGTAIDLLLLSHYEDVWQFIPLILLGVALAQVAALAVTDAAAAVKALRWTMALFVVAGAVGVYLHYSGNREFQHELDPGLSGWALFTTIITAKAPPAMAPAAMIQLGLLGLIFTYRHPAILRSRNPL